MTDKAKLYFDHFIRYGFNHTEFSEESIQMREGLIVLELLEIEHTLPHSLRNQKSVNVLSRELAEIAITIQRYAINNLKLYPSNEMLAQNMTRAKPNEDKCIRLTETDPLNNTIGSLRGLVNKLWVNGIKQESISLIIGNDKIPIPKELRFKTVASLLLRLKRLSVERKVAARQQLEPNRNQLFNAVEQSVGQYVQSLNFDPTEHQTSQSAPFITAIVLLAAGYLQTVDDYKTKDKKIEITKYCTYREIMNMHRAKTKMKFAHDIRSFDLPLN